MSDKTVTVADWRINNRRVDGTEGSIRVITNSTGQVRYCEDCGARLNPGVPHYCPGPEESR